MAQSVNGAAASSHSQSQGQGQSQSQQDPENAGGGAKKRKRNRVALSCTNCKKWKIKCSRQIPCESCLKRNIPSECHWADPAVQPPQQVFTLDTVFENVRSNLESRLQHLESLLKVQASSTSDTVARQAREEASVAAVTLETSGSLPSASRKPSPQLLDHNDDAEGAALALEGLANGDLMGMPMPKPDVNLTTLSPYDFAAQSIVKKRPAEVHPQQYTMPILTYVTVQGITSALVQQVGTKEKSSPLMDEFASALNGSFMSIPYTTFRREHDAFWDLAGAGITDFDPAWLACFSIILASVAVAFPEKDQRLRAEDLYELSRLALELADWRRRPSMRVVQCLLHTSHYMNRQGNYTASSIYLGEAVRTCEMLGFDQLGDDPRTMPGEDAAVPTGTLRARQIALRLWWATVTQDWMRSENFKPSIIPSHFNSTRPGNYDDEDLEMGACDKPPRPITEVTSSSPHIMISEVADFTRQVYELGPVPTGSEIHAYYAKLLEMDREFARTMAKWWSPGGVWDPSRFRNNPIAPALSFSTSWKKYMGQSAYNHRRLRLHRRFQAHGYRNPQFAYSSTVCVESALSILDSMRNLFEANAPIASVWFLHRHVLSAVVAIYIDVFHDADIDVPDEKSDQKLVNMAYALLIFETVERSSYPKMSELGRRCRVLVTAFEETKLARREARASGQREDYTKALKRIASNVKESISTPASTTSSAVHTDHTNQSQSSTDWLEDSHTRQLLSSLGLLTNAEAFSADPSTELDDMALWNFSHPGMDAASQSANTGGLDYVNPLLRF